MRKFMGALLVVLLVSGGLFLAFGTVETYNDFTGETVTGEFMGYVTVKADDSGQPVVAAADLPAWFPLPENTAAFKAIDAQPGDRLGIYAAFVAHEVVYQKRAIVTGSLKDSSTSWYYQFQQAYLKAAPPAEPLPTFDHELIRWPEADSV